MRPLLCLPVLLGAVACASPVVVRVEWRGEGEGVHVREVEFEDHRVTRSGDAYRVFLEHEAGWMPWPFLQHYRGEELQFTFPAPEGEASAPVSDGFYDIDSYGLVRTAFREGEVAPTPSDPDALGEFRVVFDAEETGDRKSVVTLSGPIPR